MSKIYKEVRVNSKEKKIITYPQFNSNETELVDSESEASESIESAEYINDAKEEAQRIISEANQQAEKMIQEKQQEMDAYWEQRRLENEQIIEDLKKQGFDQGYLDGKEAAEKKINEEYKAIIEQINDILTESYKTKEKIISESEPTIIDLSMKVAEKIIKKELDSDKDIIKNIVLEALKNIKEFEKISIFVNADDFNYLNNAREELLRNLNGQVDLMVYIDHSIKSGGCIIKTTTGALDAKIDTQLEEIKELLHQLAGR